MHRLFTILRQVVFVLLLAAAGGYYLYVRTPCHLPVEYAVGAIDPRFGLSEAGLLDALGKAAAIWEEAGGEDLFVYKKEGSLPVSLLYDSRQATTQKNNTLRDAVETASGTADSVKAAYNAAQTKYKQAQSAYLAAQSAYAGSLAAYNTKVAYWNGRGGAPKADYAALQAQKATLQAEANRLDAERLALNALAADANALSTRYNQLAQKVNTTVDAINQTAGREFEEGLYTKNSLGAKIDIYEYSDKEKLVRVLAHELGHSLGLEHNSNPESIMYGLNQSGNTIPTAEDIAALKAACKLK